METQQVINKNTSNIINGLYNKKIITRTIILFLVALVIYNGFSTPLPKGFAFEGSMRNISDIEFLYDLTYVNDGKRIMEQSIFANQLQLIEDAREFIILDLFLFNDDYKRINKFPDNSNKLTEKLIAQKKKYKDLKIYFITDEINNFYGAYQNPYLEKLKENGINVIITNSEKLRDSNPIYSGVWRTFIKWFGNSEKGWLGNAFSSDSPDVTLRSYLKLANFKANHRKVIITENAAIISSSNPHDASGFHSNIAFKVKGEIINDLIKSEEAVAILSNIQFEDIKYKNAEINNTNEIKASVITESKIRDKLIENIKKTEKDDEINIGVFYLSERNIINELLDASKRGVNIRIILDPNKDAFGVEKNGIPNRQVAYELHKKSNNNIKIRWYDTHGEQFHTKLSYIKIKENVVIIGGSANLTRRNLDDYNLETNLIIETTAQSIIGENVKEYFDRIWNNIDGEYTTDFDKYKESSSFKYYIYLIQEWSGLCTY